MTTCPNCGHALANLPPITANLSARQHQVLQAIQTHVSERGIAPSVRELCALVGLRSSSTMHGHLTALKRKGCVEWRAESPRSLRLLVGVGS